MTTKIEWADMVWNPVTGCTKISDGCANCYAERMVRRLQKMPGSAEKYRDGFKVRCHPEELEHKFGKKPKRIFVPSMGDLFHNEVSDKFIVDVVDVMKQNPQHTFAVLTKRPERAEKIAGIVMFPPNMWLGVKVENSDNLHRLETLRWTPCALRFVSIEPMIGPLSDVTWLPDWVIVGGESGPGARPMHPDWVREIRNRCFIHSIPFFFKQWGVWAPEGQWQSYNGSVYGWRNATAQTMDIKHNDKVESFFRVGKKNAGRLLDGSTWEQVPLEKKSEKM